MNDFLKNIRERFDSRFRYLVLARKTDVEAKKAFSDAQPLMDAIQPAIAERTYHRDPVSGMLALVIKLSSSDTVTPDLSVFGGAIAEDVAFYFYESSDLH